MSTYFSKFPNIKYNETLAKDITRRTNFIKENLSSPYVFLPYTIREGERPEDIALLYYGSIDYTWLVLLSNNIADPYTEWYIPEEQFNSYLIEKYTEISGRKGYEVIDWLKNETITENIAYYYIEVDENLNTENILEIDSLEIDNLQKAGG
jgi:hypothetical protein